jgi:hypothetical protein
LNRCLQTLTKKYVVLGKNLNKVFRFFVFILATVSRQRILLN